MRYRDRNFQSLMDSLGVNLTLSKKENRALS